MLLITCLVSILELASMQVEIERVSQPTLNLPRPVKARPTLRVVVAVALLITCPNPNLTHQAFNGRMEN